jgi:hypothetical protein
MQKEKSKFELLKEAQENNIEIKSYAQLIQMLSNTNLEDIDAFLADLKNLSFIEDEDTLYNKLPMSVFYKQLPAVVNGDILIKVVILQQAEGLALIVPENVVQTYRDLIESPEMLAEKNSNVSLYAELYNLDSGDPKLQEIIKSVYISSGNEIKPFDLKDDLAQEKKEKEEGEEESETPEAPSEDFIFDEIEEDLPEMADIEVNEEAYKKFKKQSNALETLIEKLYEKSNAVLKKNVRSKMHKKVLVIEVNNKLVYQSYEKVPAVAKKLLSNFGEAIRKNKSTQLIDSFSKDGKRYFVVAEHVANNYWYVKDEDIDVLNENELHIEPNSRTVVKLNKSSIRKESRKIAPYKKGKKIVFVGSLT